MVDDGVFGLFALSLFALIWHGLDAVLKKRKQEKKS
jgi:hypothetical protein